MWNYYGIPITQRITSLKLPTTSDSIPLLSRSASPVATLCDIWNTPIWLGTANRTELILACAHIMLADWPRCANE